MQTRDLDRFVIPDQSTILDAMQAIEDNAREVVMLKNRDEAIIGIITDGDIRRGLLRGLGMHSPAIDVMSADFISVAAETERASVLDLMKAIRIRHVPVVNKELHLLGIHFLEEIIGTTSRPNIAVIMAGGKGTRLRPYTNNIPKPMMLVAGRPILERIVLHLVSNGIRHIYLAINYLGHMIEQHFGDGSALGCRIDYLRETEELGTGGALSLLPETPKHPVMVLNGDQIVRIDIQGMLSCHTDAGADATISVGTYQHDVPFGVVHQQNGRLMRLEEKPAINLLINRGIYLLSPAALQLIPKEKFFPITELYEQLLQLNKIVATHFSEEDWLDVGRPDDLKRANGYA